MGRRGRSAESAEFRRLRGEARRLGLVAQDASPEAVRAALKAHAARQAAASRVGAGSSARPAGEAEPKAKKAKLRPRVDLKPRKVIEIDVDDL